MRAVIMAAGLGTRLRPLTDSVPKPMLRVGGRPILEHTFDALPDAVDEVILVVGYRADQITAHFGHAWRGRRVRYVHMRELNGSAAAVTLCRDVLTGTDGRIAPFLAINGDDLYDKADLTALAGGGLGILACRITAPGRFGAFHVDDKGNLIRIVEAARVEPGALINAGAYALDGRLFDVPMVRISETEFGLPQTIAQLAPKHQITIVEGSFWMPIGRPAELAAAEAALAARTATA